MKSKDESPRIIGYYGIMLFLLFIILDRLSKVWALTLNKPIDLGILEFVYVTNSGAGFSILQNQNVLLSWIAVIALGIIIFYYNMFPKISFIMIISGIIGNLIDRVSYGYVIDFINFKFWPVFNVADSLIFVGVIYTILIWIKENKKKRIKENNNRIKENNNKKKIKKKVVKKVVAKKVNTKKRKTKK